MIGICHFKRKITYFKYLLKRLNRRFGYVSYPTDKAFGVWAWTCMTLEKAKNKLDEIENKKEMDKIKGYKEVKCGFSYLLQNI